MSQTKKASLTFIFITVLVDVIGFGIIIPVIDELITKLTGLGLSEGAFYAGMLMFSFAAAQFLFAPLMGELSDRFGRRPVLLIALLGLSLDYVAHALAPTYSLLILSRILAGACGASFTVAHSYIADISKPEEKAKNFGLIGAAFGLGFMIGPFIGGIAGDWGTEYPFYISAGLTMLNFLYGYFFIPESLPKEKRRKIQWSRVIPFGALVHLFKYRGVVGVIFATFLVYLAHHAVQSTWVFYTEYSFNWSNAVVGYSLGLAGLLTIIVQGGLVSRFVKLLGMRKTVILGFVSTGVGMTLFAFATEGWMMFVFLIPFCLGGLAGPTMQGIVTNEVPENEQGELQGAITSMVSLTAMAGPPLMTTLFAKFSGENAVVYFPGAPFFTGTIFIVIGLISAYIAFQKLPPEKKISEDYEIKTEDSAGLIK